MGFEGSRLSSIRLWSLMVALAFATLTACGSSGAEPETGLEQATAGSQAVDPPAATGSEDLNEDPPVDDCDYSTFVYTPFTEIPADWPASFPIPEQLEEINGEVGVGCGRITVDMQGRYYGNSREWVAAYGQQLSAAGFELGEELDELGDLVLTYRSGQDWISYGGAIELVGSDNEYIGVGIVITDFPD